MKRALSHRALALRAVRAALTHLRESKYLDTALGNIGARVNLISAADLLGVARDDLRRAVAVEHYEAEARKRARKAKAAA